MLLRQLVKDWLLKRGMIISRPPGQFSVQGYKFNAAKARGLQINSALDGGAAEGGWIQTLRQTYPNARVLAIEPRDEVQGALRQMQTRLGNIEIVQTLLGAAEGEADFYLGGDSSSVNKGFAASNNAVRKPVTTIDRIVERTGFPSPDMIKLDLQGAELAALDGATECLKRAKAVLLEVGFIDFERGMPQIADVLAYMKQKGFLPYDILALWHRPIDGAMAQGDFLFVPESSPLRADKRYWANQHSA